MRNEVLLKYYKTLLRLPVRDVEVDENYTPGRKKRTACCR